MGKASYHFWQVTNGLSAMAEERNLLSYRGRDPSLVDRGAKVLARLQTRAPKSFEEVCEEAGHDLMHLGQAITAGALLTFWFEYLQFASESLVEEPVWLSVHRLRSALLCADLKLLQFLPRSGIPRGRLADPPKLQLDGERFIEWSSSLVDAGRIPVVCNLALNAREHWLALQKGGTPSADVFRRVQSRRIPLYVWVGLLPHASGTEIAIGQKAFYSSRLCSSILEWQLKDADSYLKPRSTFLSLRAAPRQFRVESEVILRMYRQLGRVANRLARCRAIAAALTLVRPKTFELPRDLDDLARRIDVRLRAIPHGSLAKQERVDLDARRIRREIGETERTMLGQRGTCVSGNAPHWIAPELQKSWMALSLDESGSVRPLDLLDEQSCRRTVSAHSCCEDDCRPMPYKGRVLERQWFDDLKDAADREARRVSGNRRSVQP